jgi:hypothetical protein
VQRVRRGWRDLRIALRGVDAFFGDRREIVAVDEVVRDAGVLRVLPELHLENRGGFQRRRIRLVRQGLGGVRYTAEKICASSSSGKRLAMASKQRQRLQALHVRSRGKLSKYSATASMK